MYPCRFKRNPRIKFLRNASPKTCRDSDVYIHLSSFLQDLHTCSQPLMNNKHPEVLNWPLCYYITWWICLKTTWPRLTHHFACHWPLHVAKSRLKSAVDMPASKWRCNASLQFYSICLFSSISMPKYGVYFQNFSSIRCNVLYDDFIVFIVIQKSTKAYWTKNNHFFLFYLLILFPLLKSVTNVYFF